MTSSTLNSVLIGSDSLLIECGEIWRARGHRVQAVVTDAPRVVGWARKHGFPVIATNGDYVAELSRQTPFDYLFAVTFLQMIPSAALALPRRAAINFHDGPLPRYAGLNAPAWALLHEEREYGITWHVMSERVDSGDVLKQQLFEINDDETSLSLNTRCFGLAIESFAALVDELASGVEQRSAQTGERSYFGRHARPPAACMLDFRESAQTLAALVRALDFGPRYPNTLGAAQLLSAGGPCVVTSAEASLEDTNAAPGTLVAAGADSISIACGRGTLLIRGLREPSGAPISMHSALQRLQCAVSGQLPQLSDAARAALSDLDGKLTRSEEFWVERLSALDPTEPPYLTAALAAIPGPRASASVEVPATFRSQYADTGLADAVSAAFACYIGRLSGAPQVTLATASPVTSAVSPELSPLLAACVPVLVETEPAARFADVVERFKQAVKQTHDRGGFLRNVGARYPELSESALLREPGLLPIGLALGSESPAGTALQLHVAEQTVQLRYTTTQLDATTVERIARELSAFMQNLAVGADKPVHEVELLSDAARRQLLGEWNPAHRQSTPACVHRLVEAQVDRTPDAVALAFQDRSLTFRQLDDAANGVAQRLVALGVTRDQPVGVYVERSEDLVVAALAVMKAGGAYLPLDPAYPADRIAFMLEDARAKLVVTQQALAARLGQSGAQLVNVDAGSSSALQPVARPEVAVEPANLAYLIYTSGSTGKPKGVMVEHRQVSNFFEGMDERVAHSPDGGQVFLAVTSLSFDISVLELWWSLSRGFKVVVHADSARTSRRATPAGLDRPVQFSLFYFSADAQATGSARYKLLMEGAKFADEHDFSAVWTPERHFHAFGGLYPNPAVTGAAVAAITKRVEIRAGSVVLPLHHPARVAEQWAVVDNISNGRVGVSVASGWQPNDFVFAPDNYKDAKGVMMRNLEIVRRLWRGETVEFDGPMGKVPVRTLPDPVQKELPVWITTAGNTETFEMAGAAGANLLTHLLGQSLEKLAPKIAAYRRARAAAGFDPETGIVSLMLHSFVGEDREEVKATVREPLKGYLATSMDLIKDKAWVFPAFQRPNGKPLSELDADLTQLSDEDRDALLEAAFERYFEHSGLFGTVDDALAMVEKVKAIGVDDVACLIDFGAPTGLVLSHLPFIDEVRRRELQARGSSASVHSPADVAAGEHPFLRDVRTHAVTHMQCTPSMARMLLDHGDSRKALGQVKHLLLGGEALPADLLAELRQVNPASPPSITNMYGPTETTVWSSTHAIAQHDKQVPIGKPIVNTTFYVTDAQGRLLPAGVAGELWIGGDGVTRGYWERPELTAERFVSDPFSTVPQARMYRTGDRARWRDDGVMEFLGRADHQVKLRGYRIELGEIEARTRALPGVKDAVVIVREDRPGDQRLVGYIVPDGTAAAKLDFEQVRERLREQLPEFMVPGAWVELAELPLTPNRKTDRKALPAPQLTAASAAETATQAPENETDKAIAEVWRDVLGREQVGLDDNFFDLGGHSLLVVRAHRLLQDALARPLALTDLYRFPTIRRLSTFLSQGASSDTQKAGARGAKRREAMRRRG